MEEILNKLSIPSEEIDFNLENYSKFACALMDIPIH